jgi:hypothetical protein
VEPAITPIALFGTHYGVTWAGMGRGLDQIKHGQT